MMLALRILGALLVILGIAYMAWAALYRGRLSDPRPNPTDTAAPTLEPRRKDMGFLGLSNLWPGLALFAAGLLVIVLTWALAPTPVAAPEEGTPPAAAD